MIYVALNILSSVAFGHVMKWSGVRGANRLWVGAINYLAAALLCAALMLVYPPAAGRYGFVLLTGAWAGVCYLLSLLCYFAAVARLGMGMATAAIRISVGLPVIAALLIWREPLTPAQGLGLLLVAVAFPLLGSGSAPGAHARGVAWVLAPLFLVTGAGQVANRIFTDGAPAADAALFLTALFACAGIAALIALALEPARPRRQDLWLGALLGLVNASTNVWLLLALRNVPSHVAFSVTSAGSVALAALTGVLVWRERLSAAALGGVAGAIAAVLLLVR